MNTPKRAPALEPAIIVIFGITGDLSRRKLLPALYHLIKNNLLHEKTVILGVTRRNATVAELLDDVELCINEEDGLCDPATVQKMHSKMQMLQLDIARGEEYDLLLQKLNTIEDSEGVCMNRLYYLSIPPQVTGSVVTFLGEHGLNTSCPHGVAMTRLLIEKPFGYDFKSAEELISTMSQYFGESQLFRIDHYLAKETVQNITTFRVNNIFESIWSADHISHIIINATETIDIEGRTIFYEQVGALRDIIQSHLLQLLAVVTLDLPKTITSDSLHEAKLELLKTIRPVMGEDINNKTVRGQYDGYVTEVNNPSSSTETYAAVELSINSKRWQNVPIFLRTGKALKEKITEVRIVFRAERDSTPYNVLIFSIQPHESIKLYLEVKRPGFEDQLQTAPMDFNYQTTFDDHGHPDAYERVLVDSVRGDHTLFATSDEVMAAWRVVEPILSTWQHNNEDIETYQKGSWGPSSADRLIEKSGIGWESKPAMGT